MSHQETYNISWHTYTDHLRTMLHDMLATANLSDVTLVSDDNKQIRAHKFVLSYSSPVFKNIIGNLHNDAMIFLRGIMHQELKAILEFLYVGQVSIPKDRVDEFFKVASDLQIQSLWQRNQERSVLRSEVGEKGLPYIRTHYNFIAKLNRRKLECGLKEKKLAVEKRPRRKFY